MSRRRGGGRRCSRLSTCSTSGSTRSTSSTRAGRRSDAGAEVARLGERLDAAYRTTAANLPANAAVQVEDDDLVLSALDKLEEPASLVALRSAVQARMPRLDLPELLLEVHARTGFADGFTRANECGARADEMAAVKRWLLNRWT
jgi:hypothetical protein